MTVRNVVFRFYNNIRGYSYEKIENLSTESIFAIILALGLVQVLVFANLLVIFCTSCVYEPLILYLFLVPKCVFQ